MKRQILPPVVPHLHLVLPLYVDMPRKKIKDKRWWLNVNNYRGCHPMILAQVKDLYTIEVFKALGKMTRRKQLDPGPWRLEYIYFKPTRGRVDLANVLAIVDKFTCDALVEAGVVHDDREEVFPEIDFRYGGHDKENPRIELSLYRIGPKPKTPTRPF